MADNKKQIIKNLDNLATQLYAIANACAIKSNDDVAILLYASIDSIQKAQKALNGEKVEMPVHLISRSMGIDLNNLVRDINNFFDDRREKINEN
jgi:hypothetical protein